MEIDAWSRVTVRCLTPWEVWLLTQVDKAFRRRPKQAGKQVSASDGKAVSNFFRGLKTKKAKETE
jgi:hypothetical protein